MSEESEDTQRVKKACEDLAEHFDTVQIFTTRHNPDGDENAGTVHVTWGSGSYFARLGQVWNWLQKQRMLVRIDAQRDYDA